MAGPVTGQAPADRPGLPGLPTGTVTFLITDVEGSTRLLQELREEYPALLGRHNALVRGAVTAAGGVVVSSAGDSVFAVFRSAGAAAGAAAAIQRAMAAEPWPGGRAVGVRIGVHTGEGVWGGDDYVGLDVHRAARISAAAHGGQVLVSAATAALIPFGGELTWSDLGEYRLKDLVYPERLYQLEIPGLPREFPPVRSAGGVLTILPVPRTSFVPRPEVDEAIGLLAGTRLLTLTGPGGTGKTRLALEVALRMTDRCPDGVVFVDLAPVVHPDLVASAIAGTLQVPSGRAAPVERLVEHLRAVRVLLVLDNVEQVLAAAPVVGRVLDDCAGVRVLATSRAALRLAGEQELPVPPLRLPPSAAGDLDPEVVLATPAARLFVERARAVRPSLRLDRDTAAAVARIVESLDGLPLAVELAAARVRLLSPPAIADRLGEGDLGVLGTAGRDAPARHRSLDAVIGWSYDLLEPAAQEAFRRFSVFVESVALDQIGAVLCPEGADRLLEVLESLAEQSLLGQVDSAGEVRFRMLATIREYGLRRLAEDPDELRRTQATHAGAFRGLVEQAAPYLTGWDQRRWVDRLDRDAANVRAALDWCLAEGDGEAAARFVAGLWRYWQIGGHLDEGAERASAALALPCPDDRLRAAALEAAGGVAWWRGDMPTATKAYGDALALVEPLGDPAATANAQFTYGLALGFTGSFAAGMAMLDEALEGARRSGDRLVAAWTLWAKADVAHTMGDWVAMRDWADQATVAFRALDEPFGVGWSLALSGNASTRLGGPDLPLAKDRLQEAARLFARFRDVTTLMMLCWALAQVASASGQPERALRLTGAARRFRQRTGAALLDLQLTGPDVVPLEAAYLDELGSERVARLIEEGGALSPDEVVAYLLDEMP